MGQGEIGENENSSEVLTRGSRHVVDSFECAIQAIARVSSIALESHRSWSRGRREVLLRRSQWPSGNVPRREGAGGVTTRDYGQSPLLKPWTRLTQATRQHLNDQIDLAVGLIDCNTQKLKAEILTVGASSTAKIR